MPKPLYPMCKALSDYALAFGKDYEGTDLKVRLPRPGSGPLRLTPGIPPPARPAGLLQVNPELRRHLRRRVPEGGARLRVRVSDGQ